MDTFYLVIRVIPSEENPHLNEVEGALVSCWVCSENSVSALALANFKVRQLHWEIVGLEESPIKVTEEQYLEKEGALERYKFGQVGGMSMAITGWSRDGKSSWGPVKLKNSNDFVLSDYLSEIGDLRRKGRCLHFDAGERCTESVDAHSIQKNGALSLIAQSGRVYVTSKNFSDTKQNKGGMAFTKQGVGKVSTFRGFCGKHDNELFEPIDNSPLASTQEQITLYAYRSLCREIFVKENSVALFQNYSRNHRDNRANRGIFDAMLKGSTFALRNLMAHKGKYDLLLSSKSFGNIKSVLFHSLQAPSVVFSGLLYPDYDFMGRRLQDLSDHTSELDLITFSFAPMSQGWCFLFAWHVDSSQNCVPLIRSLATVAHESGALGNSLFRFVVSSCENLAMSPVWWESLTDEQRAEVTRSANHGANVFSPLKSDYLVSGLENIAGWEFDYVKSDLE